MEPDLAPDLRRGVLAVSVLHDVDLEPGVDGVLLPGRPPVEVAWSECAAALAGAGSETGVGRLRLLRHLRARRWAADLSAAALQALLVPAGLPVGHVLHPGTSWVAERVRGGALELGPGALGLDPDAPDAVVLLPAAALAEAGLDRDRVWGDVRPRLEQLGAITADRARADARGTLRPCGPCDVVTLLGARSLRTALAAEAGGLVGAVVPMLRRGWTRLSLVDPAFGPAAAAATSAEERGFVRPLLVTADELTLVAEGGSPVHALPTDPRRRPGS